MAMSPEERRERDRERKREARARERAEREANKPATAPEGPPPTVMHDAVDAAIAAAKWLTGTDAASIAQARALAARIDLLEHEGETTKALSAHRALSQVLNDLGITATRRMQYELRSLKSAPRSGGDEDDEREQGEGEASKPSNVTQLRRPAKRRS
jgi:hypothetical protein